MKQYLVLPACFYRRKRGRLTSCFVRKRPRKTNKGMTIRQHKASSGRAAEVSTEVWQSLPFDDVLYSARRSIEAYHSLPRVAAVAHDECPPEWSALKVCRLLTKRRPQR